MYDREISKMLYFEKNCNKIIENENGVLKSAKMKYINNNNYITSGNRIEWIIIRRRMYLKKSIKLCMIDFKCHLFPSMCEFNHALVLPPYSCISSRTDEEQIEFEDPGLSALTRGSQVRRGTTCGTRTHSPNNI